jgi:3'-phosphoadenosine 5'-phosphosulfate sulfotransferase (PAPS reductase)/FAD synthetase
MKNLVTFSGGKDSTALVIWAINNLGIDNFDIIFCDTGHEAKETYDFILSFVAKTGKELIMLKSKKYEDFFDLVDKKKRFPSTKARFCTTELKVVPMIDYILSLSEDVKIYQGIRHQESFNRSKLSSISNYFSTYFIKGHKGFVHRKKDVKKWCTKYEATAIRPIITWSTTEVFKYISKNGFARNPLYDRGYTRVGCFPCINCNHREMTRRATNT